MNPFRFEKPVIQPLVHPAVQPENKEVDVLRLDQLDPLLSGNKWFKLTLYLQEALDLNKKRVVTFGGAWSNHLLATAAACQRYGLASAALVRGERLAKCSQTLQDVESMGMQLYFLSRQDYGQKKIPEQLLMPTDYTINEGGTGAYGVQGASTILDHVDKHKYTHIICAAGTGTTLTGLINAAAPGCTVLGIPVLHDRQAIEGSLKNFICNSAVKWQLLVGYEWGGYAKHPDALLSFMNEFYKQTSIPTDIVYTAKLFNACIRLLENDFIGPGSRVLIIHSGGLQGNRSLATDVLCFS